MTTDKLVDDGRAPSGQALAVPAKPASGLVASRFDPSRRMSVLGSNITRQQIAAALDVMRGNFRFAQVKDAITRAGVSDDEVAMRAADRLLQKLRKVGAVKAVHNKLWLAKDEKALAAIAIEARRAGTPKSDPVHESAGPKDIAQGGSHDNR